MKYFTTTAKKKENIKIHETKSVNSVCLMITYITNQHTNTFYKIGIKLLLWDLDAFGVNLPFSLMGKMFRLYFHVTTTMVKSKNATSSAFFLMATCSSLAEN